MVGNNFPVFFIRDGIKFPDMVHALKPNPKSHIQEGWRIADFFSHHPEVRTGRGRTYTVCLYASCHRVQTAPTVWHACASMEAWT